MSKIDISAAKMTQGSGYPRPHDEPCRERVRRALGDAAGPEGNRFTVDLSALPGQGRRTVVVALALNGNTMNPDVRVVPWTR